MSGQVGAGQEFVYQTAQIPDAFVCDVINRAGRVVAFRDLLAVNVAFLVQTLHRLVN